MINTPMFEALKREKELTEMLDYLTNKASSTFLQRQFYIVIDKIKKARDREQAFIDNNIEQWLEGIQTMINGEKETYKFELTWRHPKDINPIVYNEARAEVIEEVRQQVIAKSKPLSYRDSEDMGMISRHNILEILDKLSEGKWK